VDGPPSLTLSLRGAAAALLPAAAGAGLLPHHPWGLNPRWVREFWRYGTRRRAARRPLTSLGRALHPVPDH